MLFGLGATRVIIRTARNGRRSVAVKGRRTSVAVHLASFVEGLPIPRGRITVKPGRTRSPRLGFSRGFDDRLAQRIRNYVMSLT